MSVLAYIALGSNLENPGLQLQRAVDEIASIHSIELMACSQLYLSDPLGPEGQPDYCNAVVKISTQLEPLALLDAMQAIEQSHGRVRTVRWGPRTLDLDILLYGNKVIESERLTIPHYQMHARNFVLCPLSDINPELILPGGKLLSELVQQQGKQGLSVLAPEYPWF